MTLLAAAGALVCALATAPASAADFGISFHYSSYTPRCYSTGPSRYYSTWAPREYVYYNDCYDYGDFYDPAVYLAYSRPRVVVYDDCYPRTYRTTYTRSRCYTRPARHSRVKVHYRSGQRIHHHRKRATYRRYYPKPRPAIRVHRGYSSSHHRYAGSRLRRSGLPHRHSSSYHRYYRPQNRLRIYRR